MVATLSRAGTGWSLSDQRSYDAWGSVRAGVGNGDPSGRYCANLGHKQDDESGVIYMRARYYEPSSGRFISEDPSADGENWYIYSDNSPLQYLDPSGRAIVTIGNYWVYMQNKDGHEIAWGEFRGGKRVQLGQVKPDGSLKHPSSEQFFNKTVQDAFASSKSGKWVEFRNKAQKWGRYGVLGAAVFTTSLDSAFLSDPAGFADLIDWVGGSWDLLGGEVNVSG